MKKPVALPRLARCMCIEGTLLSKKKKEEDAGCLDACPPQAIYGVFKKGEKMLEPQKKTG